LRILNRRIAVRWAHPAPIWLLFVWFTLYLSSPSPFHTDPPSPSSLRLLIASLPIAGWLWAKWKAPPSIKWGEFSTLLIAFALAKPTGIALQTVLPGVDWAYLWAILVFLAANIVFLRNRQNIRDDLISLEYYTLRRFITDKSQIAQTER